MIIKDPLFGSIYSEVMKQMACLNKAESLLRRKGKEKKRVEEIFTEENVFWVEEFLDHSDHVAETCDKNVIHGVLHEKI